MLLSVCELVMVDKTRVHTHISTAASMSIQREEDVSVHWDRHSNSSSKLIYCRTRFDSDRNVSVSFKIINK